MIFRNTRTLVFFVSLICSFFLNCEDDNPVKHSHPIDYAVYFYDAEYDQYLAYHTASGMLDTIPIPYELSLKEITVSADGQLLYIPFEDIVAVVDVTTLETIIELPFTANEITVSQDGQMVAFLGNYLYILNISDYSVIYADSNLHYVTNGVFSKDSKTFYFSTKTSHLNYISMNGTVELTRKIISTVNNKFAIWSVIPSSSGNLLFLYLKHYEEQYLFSFSIYDQTLDSIIYSDSLIPGEGNIALTNDERYIIYTNPGKNYLFYPDPPYSFKVFNTSTLQIEDEIGTIFTFNKDDTVYLSINQICLTPDNKFMLGTGIAGDDDILIYDIRNNEIKKLFTLGGYRYITRPTCQLQVKQ